MTQIKNQSLKTSTGRWNKKQRQLFIKGLETYGKKWKLIAKMIPSRSLAQIRSHAQKYFIKKRNQYYDSDEDISINTDSQSQYDSIVGELVNEVSPNLSQYDHSGTYDKNSQEMSNNTIKKYNQQQLTNHNDTSNKTQNILTSETTNSVNCTSFSLFEPITPMPGASFFQQLISKYYHCMTADKFINLVDLPTHQSLAKFVK